jgi:hypothetical protein
MHPHHDMFVSEHSDGDPNIIGVFINVNVKIFIALLHSPPVDVEKESHNAHILVFETKGGCKFVVFLLSWR